jgi:hypothetical protein
MRRRKGLECKTRINKTAPASSHRENNRGVQQEGFRTGVPEASKQDVQRNTKNQELGLVEGSTSSKMEKKTAYRAKASNVEMPAPNG